MNYTEAEERRGKLVDAVTIARFKWYLAIKIHQIDYTERTEKELADARCCLTKAEDALWEFDMGVRSGP